jgi:hypothetical protein
MSRILLAILTLGVFAGVAEASTTCSKEVAEAVKKQAESKMFRKETNMITQNGPAKMTVEVIAPDRMRQVVKLVTNPVPVESLLIGGKAWSKQGDGPWKRLGMQDATQLMQFFNNTLGRTSTDVGQFRCLGIEPVEGTKLRAYLGIEEAVHNPLPGKKSGDKVKNEAERVIYLDPKTGRLMRTVYARKGEREKPIFAEVFSYPTDIKIEAPQAN